jgi:hypothetical protein
MYSGKNPTFRRNIASIFSVEEYAKQEISKKEVVSRPILAACRYFLKKYP